MKLQIQTLTTLLSLTVILFAGCDGSGQKTAPEHADPFAQAVYGPVAANSRETIKLPLFPDPSFERLIERFMVDVADKIDEIEMRKRKKDVISNPDLLWKPNYIVPNIVYADPRLIGVDPFKGKIRVLSHDQKGSSISEKVVGYPGIKSGTELPFTGKILYTTKDQEMRVSKLEKDWRLPIFTDDYYREKYEILLEGIDPLTAAQYLSQFINEHRIKDATLKELGVEYALRALQKNPTSVIAMHVWVRCHPNGQQFDAYKHLLKKFPNAAFAHERIAAFYFEQSSYDAALEHIQKAIQLDSRISKNNPLLARCYAKLGKLEQSIAAYQALSWLKRDWYGDGSEEIAELNMTQRKLFKQQRGHEYGMPLEPVMPIDVGAKE